MDKRRKGQNLLSKRMPGRAFSSFFKKKKVKKESGWQSGHFTGRSTCLKEVWKIFDFFFEIITT